jgi:hypothetical protein
MFVYVLGNSCKSLREFRNRLRNNQQRHCWTEIIDKFFLLCTRCRGVLAGFTARWQLWRNMAWTGILEIVLYIGICPNCVSCDGATEDSDHVPNNHLEQINPWVVHEIPAEWLPVRCGTKRPAWANGRDCRTCARNVCHEPSDINPSGGLRPTLDWGIWIPASRGVLTFEGSWQSFLAQARQSRPITLPGLLVSQRKEWATLLEFHVPLTNWFARSYFFMVHSPKSPLHRHCLLSFLKFQDTGRLHIRSPHHISLLPLSSGETCNYATDPGTQTKTWRDSVTSSMFSPGITITFKKRLVH